MKRYFLLVLFACLMARPLPAQDNFSAELVGLGASFSETAATVERLGISGNPRALVILKALQDGKLIRTADGRILLVQGDAAVDAATGAALNIAPNGAEPVRLNNRVRAALRSALGQLQLLSADDQERSAAADAVFRRASAENIPLIATALARETDTTIKTKLQLALAASQLAGDDAGKKLQAIATLGSAGSPEAREVLLKAKAADKELAAPIDAALARIEQSLALRQAGETLIQGLSLGSVLLLAALGLAITFGVMGVINMAHGEFVMLGAYATYLVQEVLRGTSLSGWALPLAIPIAFLATALIGAILERTLIRHLYGRPLETLLMTFGVGMILQQGIRLGFGAQNREVISPAWMQGTLALPGGISMTQNRLWIILFGVLVFIMVMAVIRFTRFGLEMRAVVQNRRIAATMGIRTGRVDALTFAFGSGLAGLAGVALSQIDNVSPNLGTGYIIDSFMVVVFGGVGSLIGTLVGAVTLGIINKVLEPYAGAVLAKVFVLVAIMLFIQRRPRGLFALKGRAAEA